MDRQPDLDFAALRPWSAALVTALVLAFVVARTTAVSAAGPVDTMRERVLDGLALKPGMVVAEIGVGGGWFVVRVAERIGPDGVVYGTDIDPQAIALVQQKVPDLKQPAGRVDLRLCRDPRDTALDDLPDNRVDIVLMIDSLCFDGQESRARNVEYLRRFLRVLRPGGRLVHHMDCHCDVTLDAVKALFPEAGFSPQVETIDATPDRATVDADWPCHTDAERARHAFIGVFRKPDQ